MPNHITTKILIGADEKTRKAIRVLLDSKYDINDTISTEGEFDFNKLIPMPKELTEIHTGGCVIDDSQHTEWKEEPIDLNVNDAIKALKSAKINLNNGEYTIDYNGEKHILNKTQVKNLRKAKKNKEETFTVTKKIALSVGYTAELIANYGTASWYDWAINNWGTKWNAYYVYWSTANDWVEIQTAWSTPVNVIEALSTRFPLATFVCVFADEDIGHNCGVYVLQDGNCVYDIEPDGDVAYRFAMVVKGFDEYEWDDEEPSEPIDPNNFMLRIAHSENAFEVLRILKE